MDKWLATQDDISKKVRSNIKNSILGNKGNQACVINDGLINSAILQFLTPTLLSQEINKEWLEEIEVRIVSKFLNGEARLKINP